MVGNPISRSHLTRVYIDPECLAHNMRLLQSLVGRRPLWPAVKANAYGHGAEIIARHLVGLGYKTLCVAHVAEAAELAEKGIDAGFIVFSPTLPENCEHIARYGFESAVCAMPQVRGLAKAARKTGKRLAVHLKVDTGMGRVGIKPEDTAGFLDECGQFPEIFVKGIMSHFPMADDHDKSYSLGQIKMFGEICAAVRKRGIPFRHFANSAAIFDLPDSYLDAARPGISIYGLKPSGTMVNPKVDELKPVLSWKTQITFLKEVPKGTGLSYGHTYYTDKPSLIATIPLGYGDGMSRLLGNKLEVLVCGTRCRQVGRICMDQCLLDVTALRGRVELGDEAVIVGKQGDEEVAIDEIAEKMGTINYEIATAISERVPRTDRSGTDGPK